jgi:hypothetical protein
MNALHQRVEETGQRSESLTPGSSSSPAFTALTGIA